MNKTFVYMIIAIAMIPIMTTTSDNDDSTSLLDAIWNNHLVKEKEQLAERMLSKMNPDLLPSLSQLKTDLDYARRIQIILESPVKDLPNLIKKLELEVESFTNKSKWVENSLLLEIARKRKILADKKEEEIMRARDATLNPPLAPLVKDYDAVNDLINSPLYQSAKKKFLEENPDMGYYLTSMENSFLNTGILNETMNGITTIPLEQLFNALISRDKKNSNLPLWVYAANNELNKSGQPPLYTYATIIFNMAENRLRDAMLSKNIPSNVIDTVLTFNKTTQIDDLQILALRKILREIDLKTQGPGIGVFHKKEAEQISLPTLNKAINKGTFLYKYSQ